MPPLLEAGAILGDFADEVCKGYSSLVRAPSTSYRDRLIASLADLQLKGDYFDGLRVRASENGHLLHIVDDDSDESRRCRIPPSGANGDDFDVVFHSARPL